jgi:hypothetical protein
MHKTRTHAPFSFFSQRPWCLLVLWVGPQGGKVALAYLEAAAAGHWADRYLGLPGVPRSVWTLDSVPGPLQERTSQLPPPDEKESVASVLTAVAQVKTPVATKADVATQLEALGCSRATAQWMTTNLRPVAGSDGGFEFVFKLDTCKALYADYAVLDFLPLVQRAADGEVDCSVDLVKSAPLSFWLLLYFSSAQVWRVSCSPCALAFGLVSR